VKRSSTRLAIALLATLALAACGGSSDPAWTPPAVVATAGNTENFVTWSGGSAPTCFNVYWSATPGLTTANGNRAPGQCTGFHHAGLTNGTTYHYLIVALVDGAEGWTSAVVTATPSGPSNVAAEPRPGQLLVSWDPVEGATDYYLYWLSTPLQALTGMNREVGVTSPHLLDGLGGGPYYLRVSAVVGGVETPASPELEATPGAP
jgi:hypothetical protein